ncbi:hypothetical protein Leryth_015696 [Lithospermum erythrorhizon]|nr:hypothetical protein Leryth_015696 [Lithospermum erythrorhizon]
MLCGMFRYSRDQTPVDQTLAKVLELIIDPINKHIRERENQTIIKKTLSRHILRGIIQVLRRLSLGVAQVLFCSSLHVPLIRTYLFWSKKSSLRVFEKGKSIEEGDVDNLTYLPIIAKQTLRLHPPV